MDIYEHPAMQHQPMAYVEIPPYPHLANEENRYVKRVIIHCFGSSDVLVRNPSERTLWTQWEDDLLLEQIQAGIAMEEIAARLIGRTKQDCNTRLRKLLRMHKTGKAPADLAPLLSNVQSYDLEYNDLFGTRQLNHFIVRNQQRTGLKKKARYYSGYESKTSLGKQYPNKYRIGQSSHVKEDMSDRSRFKH